jgi:hypothetical protein
MCEAGSWRRTKLATIDAGKQLSAGGKPVWRKVKGLFTRIPIGKTARLMPGHHLEGWRKYIKRFRVDG